MSQLLSDDSALLGAQRGLLMRATYGQILTVHLDKDDKKTFDAIISLIQELDALINAKHPDCGLVAAFSPKLWGKWTGRHHNFETAVLDRGIKFLNTGGDVLLFLKTPDHDTAATLVGTILPRLEHLFKSIEKVIAGKRPDVRIMGGRYPDGITNPNDAISLTADILVSGDQLTRGGSFAFSQKFHFSWPDIATQTASTQDEMIGRNTDGVAQPQHNMFAHTRRANVSDKNGDQRKILRQSLAYGTSKGHAGREEGIMFVAFCNEQPRFEKILKNLLGDNPETPTDRLMDVVGGVSGSYWYVPSAAELKVSSVTGRKDLHEEPHWQVRSKNNYLFYNSQDYLHQMSEGRYICDDIPSARLLLLMARTFAHWRDGWTKRKIFPRLPHLSKLVTEGESDILKGPVSERKGLANLKTLSDLLSSPDSKIAHRHSLLRINARELIVGVVVDFTLGRGREVVPYLSKGETLSAWVESSLDESSAMGHIVPDYEKLVERGLGKLLADIEERHQLAVKQKNKARADFYQSTILSLRGVQAYLRNWSVLASRTAASTDDPVNAENMKNVSERLTRLVDQPPKDFQDAVQLIYSMHCCLHLVGELTTIGRLDQILWPFLQRDGGSMDRAQEIVDCLFVKLGENAFVNRAFLYDHMTYGTGAVYGRGSNHPQGGAINQWVQQITIGGYKATDSEKPEGGANPVTLLFLKSARRIPTNAPSLSFRVYEGMEDVYLQEAAKSILSGGAQPTLYSDDKLCEGLLRSGKCVSQAWSRNYAADGCFEPLFAGASEFWFNNVSPMSALEQTINEGATYGQAGEVYLRGFKRTFRSPRPGDIESFEQLKSIFLDQLEWETIQSYYAILQGYGKVASVCPSPLLSVLTEGCIEKGIDLTNGGAKFHIISLMAPGMANTIDSLYAIQQLVFDPATALTTLPELVDCLINDWGFNMVTADPLQGPSNASQRGQRFQELRDAALMLPKWGSGNSDVDAIGKWLVDNLVQLGIDTIRKPPAVLKPLLDNIYKSYGPDFEFVIQQGIATFEGFVGAGLDCGASADGRRKGMALASDMSPVPGPQDLSPSPSFRNIYQAMKSYQDEGLTIGIAGAEVDMNIEESFPLDKLQSFIADFANGKVGGNFLAISVADPSTYAAARKDPERFDLLRVRMGGWSEFYGTMYTEEQKQIERRVFFTPE